MYGKKKKNENGDVIDKFCVYESKGLGFVLFKNESDAIKAKETLNEKNYQYLGHNLKLIIEDYDYNKGEKNTFKICHIIWDTTEATVSEEEEEKEEVGG